jgi:colanic acid/amylovoran biosynthesis glycosyltransferase
VILEALMHRVPVVATAVSGTPELTDDGVTGILIQERDPAAIAAAVQGLIVNRDEAAALVERGRLCVRQQFDPKRNHCGVLDFFRQAVRLK